MDLTPDNNLEPTLTNPFEEIGDTERPTTEYELAIARGLELQR